MIDTYEIKFKCKTCKKWFKTIRDVNRHIARAGCNEKNKVKPTDYFTENQLRDLYKYNIVYDLHPKSKKSKKDIHKKVKKAEQKS